MGSAQGEMGFPGGPALLWPEARAQTPVAHLQVSPTFWAEKPLRAGLPERCLRASPAWQADLETVSVQAWDGDTGSDCGFGDRGLPHLAQIVFNRLECLREATTICASVPPPEIYDRGGG